MGIAAAPKGGGREPRCEGIIIGHIFDPISVNMTNMSVPQARVYSD